MSESENTRRLESGTTSALDRMALTGRLTGLVIPLLEAHGFRIHEFGQHIILQQHKRILARLKRLDTKKSEEILMVKFAPDYVFSFNDQPEQVFLMDAKASITPVFFPSQIEKIRQASRLDHLDREDIGEVEREAWDVYNRFYPKDQVAICFACPYNPRVLLTEWVSRIKPLYRLDIDRNLEASGSGTPHVNIHLGQMRTLKNFVQAEFGVSLGGPQYEELINFIKTWPLNKPVGRVNWTQFNNVVKALKRRCPWLEERWPSEPKAVN